MRVGSLFSGYGGLDMAVNAFFGSQTAWVSEIDPGACKILAHHWPEVPNHGDITAIDWASVEPVDILTLGFPCQDVSPAGKRAGLRPGTRSGLWSFGAYAISQLRPRLVVVENVRGLLSASAHSDLEPCPWCMGGPCDGEPVLRALGAVLGDLAELGYDTRWVGLRAADVGAPHGRFRVFVVATDASNRAADRQRARSQPRQGGPVATDTLGERRNGRAPEPVRGPIRRVAAAGGSERVGTTADADQPGPQGPQSARGRLLPAGSAAADTPGDGRHQGRPEPARLIGGPDAAERGATAADASGERHGRGQDGRGLGRLDSEDAGGSQQRERTRQELGDRGAAVVADTDSARRNGTEDSRAGGSNEGGRTRSVEPQRSSERAGTVQLHEVSTREVGWGPYEPAIRRWERILGRLAPPPTETSPKGSRRLSPKFVEFMMGLPAGHVTAVPGLSRNDQLKALGNGVVPQQAYEALRRMVQVEVASTDSRRAALAAL